MQLDRIPPRAVPAADLPSLSTDPGTDFFGLGLSDTRRRRLGFRGWMAVSFACWSLLGQGEVCRIDPRFGTPGAALATYWDSLRDGDFDRVAECFADPATAMPRPGMVWFLPPAERIEVHAVRYVPGEPDHVVATYELRFQPVGSSEELSVVTGSELRRVAGEWRLVGLAEDVVWPDWKPAPRPIDS